MITDTTKGEGVCLRLSVYINKTSNSMYAKCYSLVEVILGGALGLEERRATSLYSKSAGVVGQSRALCNCWQVAQMCRKVQLTRLQIPLFQATQMWSSVSILFGWRFTDGGNDGGVTGGSWHRVQNDAGEVPCPRIVAACRLGSNVFQEREELMEICLRKTRLYSIQPFPSCLRASRINRREYANLSRVAGSEVQNCNIGIEAVQPRDQGWDLPESGVGQRRLRKNRCTIKGRKLVK